MVYADETGDHASRFSAQRHVRLAGYGELAGGYPGMETFPAICL